MFWELKEQPMVVKATVLETNRCVQQQESKFADILDTEKE